MLLKCINGEDMIDDLIHYPVFDTLGNLRRFTVNLKNQIFCVVVCNLTCGIGRVAFNGVN